MLIPKMSEGAVLKHWSKKIDNIKAAGFRLVMSYATISIWIILETVQFSPESSWGTLEGGTPEG